MAQENVSTAEMTIETKLEPRGFEPLTYALRTRRSPS